MITIMTFDEHYNMVLTDENGEVNNFSFVNNMDVLKNALERVAKKHLKNISDNYENELDEALDSRMANYAYCNYKQNIRELLQKNWDAVYPIVADDLR